MTAMVTLKELQFFRAKPKVNPVAGGLLPRLLFLHLHRLAVPLHLPAMEKLLQMMVCLQTWQTRLGLHVDKSTTADIFAHHCRL